MKKTMTLRLDESQAKAIEEASRRLGRTASEIVRDAIDAVLSERTLAERAGHYQGAVRTSKPSADEWSTQLRDRNWRP